MHVQPNKGDIAGATRDDPENCAYARALKRTLECKNVFVFRSVAYIETLDEKGRAIMERYEVKSYAREYLLRFDGGERVPPGGFVFHVPSRAKKLDYKMAQYWRNKTQGREYKYDRSKPAGPRARPYSLRSGKGAVHFITAEQIHVNR